MLRYIRKLNEQLVAQMFQWCQNSEAIRKAGIDTITSPQI